MHFRLISFFLVGSLIAPSAGLAQGAVVPKSNPKPVYVHYMPWFETPATLGGTNWGWHWRMNNRNPNVVNTDGRRDIASNYYPTIGPYASSDPNVIEYHLLLMKVSGVDGVLIDWYGTQGSNGDVNSLLANSNAVVNRVGHYGMKFGVVLEDRFARSIEDTKANVRYLRDNYFNRQEYIRRGTGNDPLMGVFGPITMQSPSQWTQILAEASEDVEVLPLWYESSDMGTAADGEFAWIYEDENLDNHLSHNQAFLQHRSNSIGTVGGVAYPGFDDFYAEGGAGAGPGFVIPHNGGMTLSQTLALNASYSNITDFVQLATWNDFGEGTMLEPTLETGYSYLRQIQQFTGTPYDESELALVHSLYLGRVTQGNHAPSNVQLALAATALNNLDFGAAEESLRLARATEQFDRLFLQVQGPVTTASASYDFNDDGVISYSFGGGESDALYWIQSIQFTVLGDANLDGTVGFDDLLILAQNYQKTSRQFGWIDGSFDGDGVVGFDDLLLLAQSYPFENLAADFALARSLMAPEPASCIGLVGCVLIKRRR